MAFYNYQTVTILSGQTTSDAIDLQGHTLCGFIIPAAITSTSMTMTMSQSFTGTYVTVQDGEGADLSFAIAASKYIPVPNLALTTGLNNIKLVGGSAEGADRSIVIVSRTVS